MRYYHADASRLAFAHPAIKSLVAGIFFLAAAGIFKIIKIISESFPIEVLRETHFFLGLVTYTGDASIVLLGASILAVIIAVSIYIRESDTAKVKRMVVNRLFNPVYGNPMHYKDGVIIPKVTCEDIGGERFAINIPATSARVEEIGKMSDVISSALCGKFKDFAVVQTDDEIAFNHVSFIAENVKLDKSLRVYSPWELKADRPTLIPIQKGTYIDLETSGSMLFAGKTRSGKTTAIISVLLSALAWGRDNFGSEIIIIDPKKANLSRIPRVVTLDEKGGASDIIAAMEKFIENMLYRQAKLNELGNGSDVKWWEVGMHPSFLFIDEYVACRMILPKKAKEEGSNCSLDGFDGLIKRIVTMGASAGCFVIISIAEASVGEGGLPSMLKSAMSTKVLMRPTMTEARLMWDTEKLRDFSANRVYLPGDAWFSSTDGKHDNVSFAHFPRMEFAVYEELGALLEAYYQSKQ